MKKIILIILSALLIAGCTQTVEFGNNNIAIETSNTNSAKSYQQEWLELDSGIEYRETPIYSDNDNLLDVVTFFKFDTNNFNFSLAQDFNNPKTVSEWQNKQQAKFVTNGSYFAEDFLPTTLVKINGQKSGTNLSAETVGEVVIDEEGKLKMFVDANIDNYNNILQSFPLLVTPDAKKLIIDDSGQTAPRSVIAKDNDGNVLFIYTQSYYFSLYKMQNWLYKSDLNLQIALNLDGGPSSGYYLKAIENKISESSEISNVIIVNNK